MCQHFFFHYVIRAFLNAVLLSLTRNFSRRLRRLKKIYLCHFLWYADFCKCYFNVSRLTLLYIYNYYWCHKTSTDIQVTIFVGRSDRVIFIDGKQNRRTRWRMERPPSRCHLSRIKFFSQGENRKVKSQERRFSPWLGYNEKSNSNLNNIPNCREK